MDAIVSVTRDWAIGLAGALLVKNPADMRRFVDLTMGGTVLCGQSTFESFPGGPLKGRRNVVLSVDDGFHPAGVEVVRSLDEARHALAIDAASRSWLIGGESVYRQLLGECRRAYITYHYVELPADAWFPDLDADLTWRLVCREDGGVTKDAIPFEYRVYERL